MANLVIVESPAKAKTIKKYLGKNYNIIASMGHIRDLPEKRLSVDVKNNFKPKYEIIKGKEKLVEELCQKAAKSKNVFLATDPDREGEAISWHLSYLLKLDLKDSNRVTFNEITKNGVENGMKSPRPIDLDLVNAQQARRILDRLVGYKLSPFLSKKICKGLSAGRVQSVALRIVVDRENEIKNFNPEEYWSIDGLFLAKTSKKPFKASFYGYLTDYGDKSKNDYKVEKVDLKNESDTKNIVKELENAEYKVMKIKKGKRRKSPSPPFITSTLQQEASYKLNFQPRRTMKIAQELYEGVEVENMGAVGLITYMRTDSLRISDEAIKNAREYILEKYGDKYLPKEGRVYKTKSSSQDGHEAIRPTMPNMDPEKLKSSLSAEQYKIYKLIWERFIASQMANCIQSTTQVDIGADKYIFKASGYTVDFDGFTVLYTNSLVSDSGDEKSEKLPSLEENMILNLKSLEPNQHFTQPPPRYTEATLIKKLEEKDIGRPSTYASIVATILNREYVVKEGKSLKPTELGEVTTDLLKKEFPDIVNLKFTAEMENNLDTVERGQNEWTEILSNFYENFSKDLEKAKEDMKDTKIELEENKTDIICEKCGRTMVIKRSRFGKFIACPGYPECKNTKKILNTIGVKCPKCDGDVIMRKSKRGKIFYGCSKYPDCDFVSWDEPINQKCPKCGGSLFKKANKKSTKIYCNNKECGYEQINDN